MGIVKISDPLHHQLRDASAALGRSINAQAEHWMRVGMLAEFNPELRYRDICELLLRAQQGGDTGGTVLPLPRSATRGATQ